MVGWSMLWAYMGKYEYTITGEVEADDAGQAAAKASAAEGVSSITVNPKPAEEPKAGGQYL